MRYFLELSYNGTPFHGWQIQPNAISVQEVLEKALSTIFRSNIAITGAGRTDTGVHARKMIAHFDVPYEIKDSKRLILSLNSLAGPSINIRNILPVNNETHARFDAKERTYKYFITFHKNAFHHHLSWYTPHPLDVEKMNEASRFLIMKSDFTSFAKLHSDAKTNTCDVREAGWRHINEDTEALEFMGNLDSGLVFTIKADRFLRNMVRAIVGTLVDVGRSKISLSDFKDILDLKDRCAAGTSMPAHGLFLWDVKY